MFVQAMWKIQTHSADAASVTFSLSGRIRGDQVEELEALLNAEGRKITLDLKELDIVDRDTINFLSRCLAHGVDLRNCPLYIEQWILKERISKSSTNISHSDTKFSDLKE
jgi:hypothetical protein